jgi:hypothetical protein
MVPPEILVEPLAVPSFRGPLPEVLRHIDTALVDCLRRNDSAALLLDLDDEVIDELRASDRATCAAIRRDLARAIAADLPAARPRLRAWVLQEPW